MNIPDLISQQFTVTQRIELTIINIPNIEFGLLRSDGYWDVADFDTFEDYQFWTQRFEVFVYDESSQNILSKSYGVLNSAYLGFTTSYYILNANRFNPILTTNRVVVYPGTQTNDLSITTGSIPCRSKKVTLKPTVSTVTPDNLGISITSSFHNFEIFQMVSEIKFRVAASISLSKGLYYITWDSTEMTQLGIDKYQYQPPYSTLVEVPSKATSIYTIIVSTIPKLMIGYTSIPIKVSLPFAPASDLTLTLSIENGEGITVSPTILEFLPDVQELYFEIAVNATFDTTQNSPSLMVSKSGTDADIYKKTFPIDLTVTQTVVTPSSPVIKLTSNVLSQTSAEVTVKSSQNGVLYWWLACEKTPNPSFLTLQNMTSDLVPFQNLTSGLVE